jgi:Helicase associated domain
MMYVYTEQLLKFASIGFRFSHVLQNIDERIVQLQEFKKVHGHTQVPYDYTGHSGLGLWCKKTRDAYALNKLAASRIEKLNAIDFDWTRRGTGRRRSSRQSPHRQHG